MNVGELVLVVAGVAFVGKRAVEHLESDPDPVEVLKAKSVAGEISQGEFEGRLEVVLDDETEQIRAAVEPIPGIGPDRSRYFAEQYDSLEDLRDASIDELEDVPDVGEQRAAAIKQRLSS